MPFYNSCAGPDRHERTGIVLPVPMAIRVLRVAYSHAPATRRSGVPFEPPRTSTRDPKNGADCISIKRGAANRFATRRTLCFSAAP